LSERSARPKIELNVSANGTARAEPERARTRIVERMVMLCVMLSGYQKGRVVD